TEIAINLDMPLHVIQCALKVWDNTGDVSLGWRGGRSHVLEPAHCEYILSLLENTPDMYLDELQHQLENTHGVVTTISTISRTLHRLGVSSKKLSRMACEHSDEAWCRFGFEIGQYPAEYIVCADESAVNILTTYRMNGW
ncbi:hypothetical protein FA13DRAFT_1577402, partial [Coprinellus micaceus]